MIDLLQGLGIDTLGPPLGDTFFGKNAQPGLRIMPLGCQFARVAVAQLAEVEGATARDAQGLVKQGLRVQRIQRIETAQMPLAIGCRRVPASATET